MDNAHDDSQLPISVVIFDLVFGLVWASCLISVRSIFLARSSNSKHFRLQLYLSDSIILDNRIQNVRQNVLKCSFYIRYRKLKALFSFSIQSYPRQSTSIFWENPATRLSIHPYLAWHKALQKFYNLSCLGSMPMVEQYYKKFITFMSLQYLCWTLYIWTWYNTL